MAERAREDFGEVRKSEAWREPIQGRQTDDLQKRLALKELAWSVPTQLDVCICLGSLRWLVFHCATAQAAQRLSGTERRRSAIPIWAVSARARVLGLLLVPPRT